jgi:hypothetical protein
MSTLSKGDAVTYCALVTGAVLQALEPWRKEAAMPPESHPILSSQFWSYLPLALLILVGIIWLTRQLLPRHTKTPGTPAASSPEDFPTTEWGLQLKNVFRVEYKNETVLLDGCDFIECTFDNVTFKYNGTKPYRLTRAKGNSKKLSTDNKVVGQTILLLKDLGVLTAVDYELFRTKDR